MSHAPTADIQLFRDVFNASPIGIAVASLDGEPLLVNPAFRSFLGFSAQELRRQLTVIDHGVGFDLESVSVQSGLGFNSMRERVRLVNGTIAVDSKPSCGTTIRVQVPLEPARELKKAV